MVFGPFFAKNSIQKLDSLKKKTSVYEATFSQLIYSFPKNDPPQLKLSLILTLTFMIYFVIFVRLVDLQIINFQKFESLANGNSLITKRITAVRGIITDREGIPLVANEPVFFLQQPKTKEEITYLKALELEASGVNAFTKVQMEIKRRYLYPEETAQVLGYLGEISKEELAEDTQGEYQLGDMIGQLGLEKTYEKELKGFPGKEYFEVNSLGEVIEEVGVEHAQSGKNLKTTLDLSLQKEALLALQGVKNSKFYQGGEIVKGAIVVSKVGSGEILAMVSAPFFNANDFQNQDKKKEIIKLLADQKNFPLVNRAISAVYPPGSTFKLVVALAGLESGKISASTLIEDTGVLKIGQWEFPTWSSQRDGMMNIIKGLKRSNDIFFYKVGEMTGLANIMAMGEKFNLGRKLGIDLPGENGGLLPDEYWKRSVLKENWYLGDTYHLSIGQGFLLATPLQINAWTAAIAAKGMLYRPHLLLKDDESPKKYLIRDLKLKAENVSLVTEGMKQACQTGGTGWPFFDLKLSVACKTGTAEFGVDRKTHAVFTAFAPIDNPQIAVTVVIEEGGQGSDVAGPVARQIIEKYFHL